MEYSLETAREILSRTPAVLDTWLRDLPDAVVRGDEGPETWSPFDIVGHLIHGERADWIPRTRHILEHGAERDFEPFDRFAHLAENTDRTLAALLDRFAEARQASLHELDALELTPEMLRREGSHPEFGTVTLSQLLATWVVHDLDHMAQIARVLAHAYHAAVGPWGKYLRIVGG
jgi:uncharacterized damage-inducible protein DinB